jgi:hypothetical protein
MRTSRDALASLEDETASKLTELKRAYAAADVDAVTRLRGEVEVVLPTRLEEARLAVLADDIVTAESDADRCKTERDAAVARVQAYERDVAAAHRALDAAIQTHNATSDEYDAARHARRSATEHLARLRGERDQLLASQAIERDARLRRLAGLPEPHVQVEPTEPPMRVIHARGGPGSHIRPYDGPPLPAPEPTVTDIQPRRYRMAVRRIGAVPIPSFAATDSIAAHSELYSCRTSATIRTARSRNSGGYFLDVDDMDPILLKDRASGHAVRIHQHSPAESWPPRYSRLNARIDGQYPSNTSPDAASNTVAPGVSSAQTPGATATAEVWCSV